MSKEEKKKLTPADFEFGEILGEGGYAKVV